MRDSEAIAAPVTELADRLAAGSLSPVELTRAYLDRIHSLNASLCAYITVDEHGALRAARTAEGELARGHVRGPLHGIPVGIKDQLDVAELPTTGGSTVLNYVPDRDSTVVERLRAAGAVVLGKLNMAEFAFGGTVQHPFGNPRNPWSLDHQPGQSSNGSAVAVAASLAAASVGEDTGGSIRAPAAWCGITGLRPTWGRWSRAGMLSLEWSMDQAGPMAWTVADCAAMFEAVAGYDPRDSSTAREPVRPFSPRDDLAGVRVGVVREAIEADYLDTEVRSAVELASSVLAQAGASLTRVSIPLFGHAGAISSTMLDVAGAHLHRRWLRTSAGELDVSTRQRLLAGSLVPGTVQEQARRARALVRRQVLEALRRADVVLLPTRPTPAPLLRSTTGLGSKDDVLRQFLRPRSGTATFNLASVPALSVCCGFTETGLPIGLQLAGRPFDEAGLLQVGHAYQVRTSWHTCRPPLAG